MSSKTSSSELLRAVEQAKLGDVESFAVIYDQFKKMVFNLCIRITADYSRSQDLMHDSFLTAFEKMKTLKDPERLAAWLKVIALNKCLEDSRRTRRFHFEEVPEERFVNDSEDEETPWWLDMDVSEISKAVVELPHGCREIFTLFVFEDYGHKQISDLLGISESTSRSQYWRAKKILREHLLKLNSADGSLKKISR